MGIRNRAQVFKHTLYNLYHKVIIIVIIFLGEKDLRAFAPGIVNAICKVYLAFSFKSLPHPECYIPSIAKKICNTATVQYCISIVKKKNIYIYIYILFYFPQNFSLLSLIIYVLFSLFLLSFSSAFSFL